MAKVAAEPNIGELRNDLAAWTDKYVRLDAQRRDASQREMAAFQARQRGAEGRQLSDLVQAEKAARDETLGLTEQLVELEREIASAKSTLLTHDRREALTRARRYATQRLEAAEQIDAALAIIARHLPTFVQAGGGIYSCLSEDEKRGWPTELGDSAVARFVERTLHDAGLTAAPARGVTGNFAGESFTANAQRVGDLIAGLE